MINTWNSLPQFVVDSLNVNQFKINLSQGNFLSDHGFQIKVFLLLPVTILSVSVSVSF